MTSENLMVILIVLVSVLILLAIALLIKSGDQRKLDELKDDLYDQMNRYHQLDVNYQENISARTDKQIDEMTEALDALRDFQYEQQLSMQKNFTDSLGQIYRTVEENNHRQNEVLKTEIGDLRTSNEARLTEIRDMVSKELTETFHKDFQDSFDSVSKQLGSLYQSIGEMRQLSAGVSDNIHSLNRVLSNVKTRGTWSEVQLQAILDQTIPGCYIRNYAPEGVNGFVEFAVVLPGPGQRQVYLPIDSKMPVEDYQRLLDAGDRGDAKEAEQYRKKLEQRVLDEARSVSKYIAVPQTVPYAILYLGTEGLYAEVLSSKNDIVGKIQNELKVMIAGPSTVTALLNALSIGIRASAVNEKAEQIRKLLESAAGQYSRFAVTLEKARKSIETAGTQIDEAQKRNSLIRKRFEKAGEIRTAGSGETASSALEDLTFELLETDGQEE